MVRSHLEFGNCVWSPTRIMDIEKLERMQNRATKMIFFDKLKSLNSSTLKYRRARGDMIETYKIITETGSIQITNSVIAPSKTVRCLGVVVDPAMTFQEHVASLARVCYYHLRQLRSVRRSLSVDSCHALVRALILSRIDYCNGLLGGASNALLDQLDRVMRASARLILQKSKYDQITADMNNRLHWLDARARIDYKLCIMAFRCLNGSAPRYLARCCVPVSSIAARSHLRSAAAGELVVSASCTKTIGPRAFAVSCPTRWNALPSEMRVRDVSLAVFKKKLKTVLVSAMLDR